MNDWAGIAWLVVLPIANAFFVGAEFAVISARRSQIEPLAERGSRSAKTALYAMEHATLMLATSQLGITICSLLILNVSEPAIHHLLAAPLGLTGWSEAVVDGVAFAGILPAPLAIFATFAGYVAAGLPGAVAITAGMFLPAFAFSMIFFERLEAVVDNPALHRVLAGVAAAVVGVIAATLLQLGWSTAGRVGNLVPAALLFGAAVLAVWRWKGKLAAPALVLAGGVAGWALNL